jgi:hypothetical protein
MALLPFIDVWTRARRIAAPLALADAILAGLLIPRDQ